MADLSALEQGGILVGVIAGVGGLVLGVVNTLYQVRESKPRLRVRPFVRDLVSRYGNPLVRSEVERDVVCVELSNVGKVPIRGSLVSFEGGRGRDAIVMAPRAIDEKPWPGLIEPGESRVLGVDLHTTVEQVLGRNMKRTRMISQVGDSFRSSRSDMRRFKRELRSANDRRVT
jgi:hypothetical protein